MCCYVSCVVCWLVIVVCCSMCCLLRVVCCFLFVGCCVAGVVRVMLRVVFCLYFSYSLCVLWLVLIVVFWFVVESFGMSCVGGLVLLRFVVLLLFGCCLVVVCWLSLVMRNWLLVV